MIEADILNGVLDREGEAYDPSGPSKWGVLLSTLVEFRGGPVTLDQLKALTRDEAFEVFEHLYLARSGYRQLADERARALMVDWAVNADVPRATRWLQQALGVPVDGACGPVTVAAANRLDPRDLLKRLGLARQAFYVRTALMDVPAAEIKSPGLADLEGWLNRNWALSAAQL